MVRGGGRGGHGPHNRRLIDLGESISLAEKKDLLTLVSAITDRQHNDISTIFDSPPVSPVDNTHGHHHWLALPLLCKKESKLNIMPSVHMHKTNSAPNNYEKTHDIIEKEEKQAMTPQLSELKKEALAAFKKWQALVLQRLRDITVHDPQSTQAAVRGRGRGGRGGGGFRGRGGRGGGIGRAGLTIGTGKYLKPVLRGSKGSHGTNMTNRSASNPFEAFQPRAPHTTPACPQRSVVTGVGKAQASLSHRSFVHGRPPGLLGKLLPSASEPGNIPQSFPWLLSKGGASTS